jgi:hypothetical protein
MKTNSTLVVVIRIVAFVLLCLYSLLVFGQPQNTPIGSSVSPLSKFNGVVVSDKSIKLQWELSQGNSANTVTVEKSSDAAEFLAQAEYWVNMEGNFQTGFKWSDAKISKRTVYYRLKITDMKGEVYYSNVLQLTNKKGNGSFSAYPSRDSTVEMASL